MNNCKVCKKDFETYEAEFYCDNCDENGEEERWYDWCIGDPDMVTCSHCNGDKIILSDEYQFCSDDCRQEYFHPLS